MSWLFDFGFASLDIFYVYPEDSGTYTCLAGNQIGEAQISCQMQVSGGLLFHECKFLGLTRIFFG